jgi:hypothetical protein
MKTRQRLNGWFVCHRKSEANGLRLERRHRAHSPRPLQKFNSPFEQFQGLPFLSVLVVARHTVLVNREMLENFGLRQRIFQSHGAVSERAFGCDCHGGSSSLCVLNLSHEALCHSPFAFTTSGEEREVRGWIEVMENLGHATGDLPYK